MSVTYDAVLDVSEDGVTFLTGLLDAERVRRGTRANTRALGTRAQAVSVLRWFLEGHPDVGAGPRQRHLVLDGV